jgi:hypothetical protein
VCPPGYVVVVPCARLVGAIDHAISWSHITTEDETHDSHATTVVAESKYKLALKLGFAYVV